MHKIFCIIAFLTIVVMAQAQTDGQVSASAPNQVVSMTSTMTTTLYTSNVAMSTNQASSSFVVRSGRNYFYNNEIMRGKTYEEFLRKNCAAAYAQYRSGRDVSTAGWVMLGSGVALEAGVFLGVALTATTGGQLTTGSSNAAIICYMLGGALEIACIPTLIVGYLRMYKSADTFNLTCRPEPTAYWSVQASENGLGLALHF